MKKALIICSILLSMILAGVVSPARNSLLAQSLQEPVISSLTKEGSSAFFYLNQPGITHVVIEYRFQSNGVVFSKLATISVTLVSQSTSLQSYRYQVILPAGAESFRIWRVVKETKQYSVSGSHTLEAPGAPMDGIEVRLKTIYVNDDLIEKRIVGAVNAATL
ncbi:MAG: hypothetical protein U1C51_10255, partial [Candidatus Izemoplasmatales bacterium]|nr:hypothetical protein [Candidatus Izemoplasmatales bacterium]